jgi:uncharacterized Zn-binding protein involved in type VI secretion
MPGTLLHMGATIICGHGGQVIPTSTVPRVTLNGMPLAVQPYPVTVAGCPYPSNAGGPCVTGQFLMGATRITSMGMPVLLLDSPGIAMPTGAPLKAVASQTRVLGI